MDRKNYIPKTKRGTKRVVPPKETAPAYVPIRKLDPEVRREIGAVPGLVRTVEQVAVENAMSENAEFLRSMLDD
jgi:hypothetical protein